MRIIDRLDKYMEINKINDNQMTVNCCLSVGLLGKARRGDSDLGKKSIDKILSFYQELNKVWLLTGEGAMIKDSKVDRHINEGTINNITMPREALDLMTSQQETIKNQQKDVGKLIEITLLQQKDTAKLTEIILSQRRIIEDTSKKRVVEDVEGVAKTAAQQ